MHFCQEVVSDRIGRAGCNGKLCMEQGKLAIAERHGYSSRSKPQSRYPWGEQDRLFNQDLSLPWPAGRIQKADQGLRRFGRVGRKTRSHREMGDRAIEIARCGLERSQP